MILETFEWKELHKNGQPWITGTIGIVADLWIDIYDYLTGFKGYEGKPVCRIGIWTKHYDNGQLAWTIDYGDGKHATKTQSYPQFRRDGTPVIY